MSTAPSRGQDWFLLGNAKRGRIHAVLAQKDLEAPHFNAQEMASLIDDQAVQPGLLAEFAIMIIASAGLSVERLPFMKHLVKQSLQLLRQWAIEMPSVKRYLVSNAKPVSARLVTAQVSDGNRVKPNGGYL